MSQFSPTPFGPGLSPTDISQVANDNFYRVSDSVNNIDNTNFSTITGQPGGVWKSWTPAWTNLTVGNSTTNEGYYTQIGKTVLFYVRFVFGSTSAVTGSVSLTLPITKASTLNNATPIGMVRANDVGTAIYIGQITAAGTVTFQNASATYATEAFTSSTVPFTWTTNDVIYLSGKYEAA
jgi:hypothetical protein